MRTSARFLSLSTITIFVAVAIVATAAATWKFWWPPMSSAIDKSFFSDRKSLEAHSHEDSAEATSQSDALELSPQARLNLGLTAENLRPVELSSYRRSLTVPAVVVAKPGRSSIVVSSPLNGVVTHVHAVTGEAVLAGDLLMEVRLTYEDLVETQTAYLKTISELEVEKREITRLEEATQSGAISGKLLLERRYAKEKLDAFARSQREALRMHGLSDRQVDEIGNGGKLLRDLQIVAPDVDEHSESEELRLSQIPIRPVAFPKLQKLVRADELRPLVIDELRVHKGEAINAGDKLCSLSDYSQLFIEGKAFENDIFAISEAAKNGWGVDAKFSGASNQVSMNDLKLVFVSNSIDPDTRTLSFFVELPNEIVRDETNADGQRFLAWKYRLGQRLELRVPVEQWENQIVLPIDAVAKEGADWLVFQQNGKSFKRVPVHVRHRDSTSVVVANDGSIYPGDVIAFKAAHQMQMALRNKAGGAVDPHAGHNH